MDVSGFKNLPLPEGVQGGEVIVIEGDSPEELAEALEEAGATPEEIEEIVKEEEALEEMLEEGGEELVAELEKEMEAELAAEDTEAQAEEAGWAAGAAASDKAMDKQQGEDKDVAADASAQPSKEEEKQEALEEELALEEKEEAEEEAFEEEEEEKALVGASSGKDLDLEAAAGPSKGETSSSSSYFGGRSLALILGGFVGVLLVGAAFYKLGQHRSSNYYNVPNASLYGTTRDSDPQQPFGIATIDSPQASLTSQFEQYKRVTHNR